MQQVDITEAERAALIVALRRLIATDPDPLSPSTQTLKAILERLHAQAPQEVPETASTG
jgi:hypothetical protein